LTCFEDDGITLDWERERESCSAVEEVERWEIEEAEERKEPESLRERVEEESEFVGTTMGADNGGDSYPGCCTPSNQIGSVHLSGMESLSRRYRIALSRCPFPCLAAVRREFLPLGDEVAAA
jgi:hypothetical protein